MLVVLLLIMALGLGKPALWPFEERYVVRRAGDDS